jgi:hypothetical protein
MTNAPPMKYHGRIAAPYAAAIRPPYSSSISTVSSPIPKRAATGLVRGASVPMSSHEGRREVRERLREMRGLQTSIAADNSPEFAGKVPDAWVYEMESF